MLIYGTSKRGLDYFSRCLARELAGTPVILGQINPGMIVTDMLREGYRSSVRQPATVAWTYNAVGDLPEDAAAWIVPRMLANRRNGVLLNRQPRWVVAGRFLRAALAGPRRRVFEP
jgi:NAD(P)-dependent dehydrogenase (short-subunit alcohol dehydrogenase family)